MSKRKNSNKVVLFKSQEDKVKADKALCIQRAIRTNLMDEDN